MIIIFIQLNEHGVEMDYVSPENSVDLGHKACLGDIDAAEIALWQCWLPGQIGFPGRFQMATLNQAPLACALVQGEFSHVPGCSTWDRGAEAVSASGHCSDREQ